ncbi:MAG: hypothetical protein OEU93_13620 [Rubrivivax sp.]|nr:hypothetical protein [Rubrivivax sp.]MDH5338258.1 hypothetical protein [Rubrivivax sp.]
MSNDGNDPAQLAQRRYENALALFDQFVRGIVKDPDAGALRGLERRFAEQVLIQPSYWSQIKSRSRQIGERLARQFEQRCRKPTGWMDQAHDDLPAPQVLPPEGEAPMPTSSAPRDDDERFIVGLVLSYYRRHPQKARRRLLDLLGEVLTTPPPAPAPPPPPSADEAHTLWLRSQTGVAPLKPPRRR